MLGGVEEIIEDAKRRAGRKKKLTLVLRDLGGLIRAAGDIAVEKKKPVVSREDVIAARNLAAPIEAQVVMQAIEYTKDYKVFTTKGFNIARYGPPAPAHLGGVYLLLLVAERVDYLQVARKDPSPCRVKVQVLSPHLERSTY